MHRKGLKVVAIGRQSGVFGAIESRVGYLLHRTDVAHMDLLRQMLEPIGLTPARATAIAFISNNAGARQSDLARALGINRASAMAIVNQLVALGAVVRLAGQDKRSHSLALSDEGRRLFGQFEEISADLDEMLASGLTAEEVVQFRRLLTKVWGSVGAASKLISEF